MADRSGYIGRAPGDSSIIVARQTHSPTGVQTDFTFASGYTVGYIDAYLNGIRLINAEDYTATDGTTVGLTSAANNGDILELVAYKAFNLANVAAATGNFSVGNNLTVTDNLTVSGDATSIVNITGTAGTFTDLTVTDQFTGNATGTAATFTTITATDQFSGNISGIAATFTGPVTIGGTLTYEDATNVDSVGLVTARTGVRVTAGGIVVTAGVSTLTTVNVSSGATFAGLVDINAGGQANTFKVEDLTDNRVVIAGSGGELEDSGNLTFDGSALSVTGTAAISGIATATALGGYHYLRAPFGATVNFSVTVASKTAAHRYNGSGSSNAYVIDGIQSPFLTLTPGRTYRFTMSSSDMSSHPFRFYLEADKTTSYTTNVTTAATYTEITVTDSTPQILHYQCSSHSLMGNSVQVNSNIAGGLSGTPDIDAATGSFTGDVDIADKIIHTGDTNTAIRFPAADTFTVETGGVEAFRVTGNQRIGIGTDDPLRQLEVYDSTNAIINLKSDTQSSVIFSDPADANIGMLIYEHSSDSMYFRVNDAERVRITSNGTLGVGITAGVGEGGTPADLNSTEVGRGFINLSRDDTAAADHILFGKNGAIAASVGTDTTNTLVFKTGTDERLRINSDGEVGIGTNNPTATLQLFGDSSSSFRISKSGILAYDHTFNGTSYTISNNNGSAGIPIILGTKTAGAESVRIAANGNVGLGTNNPGNPLHILNDYPIIRLEASLDLYRGRNTIGGFQNLLSFDCDNDNAIPHSNVIFNVDGTTRLRIINDGTTIVGTSLTTTPATIAAGGLVVTNTNAGFFSNNGGDAKFGSSDNNPVLLQVNGAEKVRVTTAGSVGINNVDPADTLHVKGEIRYGSNTTYYGRFEHDEGTTGANIYTSTDSGGHIFKRNTTTHLTINPSGQIHQFAGGGDNQIISKRTNDASSNGDYFLHIRGQNDSEADMGAIGIHRDTANTNGRISLFTKDSSALAERLRIDQDGIVVYYGATGTNGGACALNVSKRANVSANGTLDLAIQSTGGGGTSYCGHLYVISVYTLSAAARTSRVYFVSGRYGNSEVVTQLQSDNGSTSGMGFNITSESSGSGNLLRFTDTSGSAVNVSMHFVGAVGY